ncbi:MAG TPA: hypothetical protein VNA24_21270 [Hyalangium sp.]|nr:hypothetical protein [Hyalangium sp.]
MRINLGTRKTLSTVSPNYLVMGFSVSTNNGAVSGWIRPELLDEGYNNGWIAMPNLSTSRP